MIGAFPSIWVHEYKFKSTNLRHRYYLPTPITPSIAYSIMLLHWNLGLTRCGLCTDFFISTASFFFPYWWWSSSSWKPLSEEELWLVVFVWVSGLRALADLTVMLSAESKCKLWESFTGDLNAWYSHTSFIDVTHLWFYTEFCRKVSKFFWSYFYTD